jgi:hypothetical protein
VALVAWEKRKRGTRYYTRSKWKDGRVIREYIGSGPVAEILAQDDELKRLQREETTAFHKERRMRLQEGAAFIKELEEALEVLVRAELVAAGCHKRKGEWRRERELRA